MKTISVIIACYNEEESLPLYFKAADEALVSLKDYQLEFVLVNDGSKDHTLEVMEKLYQERADITIVNESRNYGQNAAFSAGLASCRGDYAIFMDADLQDPVTMIPIIAEKFMEGYDVVNPHRVNRMKDSYFKRKTAGLFYKIINRLEGKKVIPENVNCFRGISRRVIDAINNLTEKDRYLLSEIPLAGYKTCTIDFSRQERQAGISKYNISRMVRYALDNMSSATAYPLYLPIRFGLSSLAVWSFVSLVLVILYGVSYAGLLSGYEAIKVTMLLSFLFLATSLIILFIGILGVYLHNILINTRNRPTYFIDFVKRQEDKKQQE